MKTLLIAYHSQTGNTRALVDAALAGAQDALQQLETESNERAAQVECVHARDVQIDTLLKADALLMATPENFGYMSGELKAMFDRTYNAVLEQTAGRAYGLMISCNNDGRGAQAAVERIMIGYGMTAAREPLVVRGAVTDDALLAARELGAYMVAALAVGLI